MNQYNKLKFLLALIIITILSSIVLSEDFTGYKYAEEPFTLNGDNFTLKLDKTMITLIVSFNDEKIIVKNNSCRDSISTLYRVCFNGTLIDLDVSPQIGKFTETSNDLVPGILIRITYKKPDIKLSRTFSNINPNLLETISVNVSIENNGKNPADFIYAEKIPDNFEILNSLGFNMEKNELVLKSNIRPLSSQLFVYSIRPINYSIAEIQGNLNYTFENVNARLFTDKTIIKPIDSIKMDITIPELLNLNQESILSYNITNINKQETLDLNFSILISNIMEITYIDNEFKKSSNNNTNLYFIQFKLKPHEVKKTEIKLKTLYTGNYTINSKIDYKITNIKKVLEKNVTTKLEIDTLYPTIRITKEMVSSNEKFKLQLILKNNNVNHPFQNIESNLKSELLSNQFITPVIMPNNEIILFEREFNAPISNENKTIYFNFSGTYETINFEKLNFSITKTINIVPIQDLVYSIYEINTKSNFTNNITISVYIENKKDDEINIISNDILDESSISINGEKERTTTLIPYFKKKVYFYTIFYNDTPKISEKITNTLNYIDEDINFLITKEITINLKNKTINTKISNISYTYLMNNNQNDSINKTLNNNFNNINEQNTANKSYDITVTNDKSHDITITGETKKESFFTKIINFFKNLFDI